MTDMFVFVRRQSAGENEGVDVAVLPPSLLVQKDIGCEEEAT